jgi:hypothetical protein
LVEKKKCLEEEKKIIDAKCAEMDTEILPFSQMDEEAYAAKKEKIEKEWSILHASLMGQLATKKKEVEDNLKKLKDQQEEDAKKIAKLVEKKKCLEEEKKIIDAKFAEMDTEILSFSPMDEEAYAAKKEQIEKEWSIVSATHNSAVKRNVREYKNFEKEMIEKQEVIRQKIKELGQREEAARERRQVDALTQKRKAEAGSDGDFQDVQSKNINLDEDTTVEDRERPVAGDLDGDGLDVESSTFLTVVRAKSPKHLYAAADAVDQGPIL